MPTLAIETGVDLVVDPRETRKQYFTRILNFGKAPLVERSELPEDKQPHQSLYGKFSCYINGINPYPPPRPPAEVQVVEQKVETPCSYQVIAVQGRQEEKKEEEPSASKNAPDVTIHKLSFDDK